MSRLTGILAATYTAMHQDGSVNLDMIDHQAHSLERNGLAGAFICGTTGEGVSLSTAERLKVAERWMAARGNLVVVVHVGHNSLEECKVLAAHAQKIGADAIAAISPTYLKPPRIEELVAFCAQVAAAAPDLPFYYYHIPSMTGVRFPVVELMRAAAQHIPNLAGAKFSDDNLTELEGCVNLTLPGRQSLNMVMGHDEQLLSALRIGAQAAVGSTYNWMAPLYVRMVRAWRAGDQTAANALQAQAGQIAGIVNRHGGLVAGKSVMSLIGLDCGPARLPLRSLTVQELAALRTELQQAGFFDVCSSDGEG